MAVFVPRFPRLTQLAFTVTSRSFSKLPSDASPIQQIEYDARRLLRVVERRVGEKERAEREVNPLNF